MPYLIRKSKESRLSPEPAIALHAQVWSVLAAALGRNISTLETAQHIAGLVPNFLIATLLSSDEPQIISTQSKMGDFISCASLRPDHAAF